MDGASWVQPCRSGLANVHLSVLGGITPWRVCWSGGQEGLNQFKQSSRIPRSEQSSTFTLICLIFLDTASPLVERCAFSKRRRHSSRTVLSSAVGSGPSELWLQEGAARPEGGKNTFWARLEPGQSWLSWMTLCLLFSVNLLYCPALLVLLTCLGLTCAIVAAIALSYRQLPACWHWGFHGVLVNQSVSSWLLACCCALDWCCKCSNALPNKTAACMGSWKLKFVSCLRASDSAAISIKRLVGVENPQIWNRLTAAPGQNQYTLYLGH